MKEMRNTLPLTFTTETARAHGVHPRDLYAWRDAGQIVELSVVCSGTPKHRRLCIRMRWLWRFGRRARSCAVCRLSRCTS